MIVSNPVVAASELRKSFNEGQEVLKSVDLEVEPNETLVILGPNGSGKTVLLACLAGGLHPDAGEVSVFGAEPAKAADQLTFLLQGSLAIPELSGRETLEFYADLHPQATDAWQDIIDRFDLTDDLDRRVREYSGGMIRKLELASVLSVDVPLYLLDEPTVELDMTTVDEFHAMIEERMTGDRTVIMSSHLPRDARAADRLALMRGGEILTTGAPEELLQAVPKVVTVSGRVKNREELKSQLLAGRLFDRDGEQCGFLPPNKRIDELHDVVSKSSEIFTREPSYADLFNYHVHVDPATDKESQPVE